MKSKTLKLSQMTEKKSQKSTSRLISSDDHLKYILESTIKEVASVSEGGDVHVLLENVVHEHHFFAVSHA